MSKSPKITPKIVPKSTTVIISPSVSTPLFSKIEPIVDTKPTTTISSAPKLSLTISTSGPKGILPEDDTTAPPIDMRVSVTETIVDTSVSLTSPIIKSPDISLKYKLLKTLGGDSNAGLYESLVGGAQIVWKPASDLVAAAEIGGSRLAHHITGGLVPIAVPMEQPDGSAMGLAQTFVTMAPFSKIGKIGQKMIDLSSFTLDQISELFIHAIADWLCSNWDTHSGNYGVGANGRIVGIDKGQSYKFFQEGTLKSAAKGFAEPRSFDLTQGINPRLPNILVYPALEKFFTTYTGTSRVPTADHDLIAAALDRAENLSTETINDCLADYAKAAFPSSETVFLRAVAARAKRVLKACEPFVGTRSVVVSTISPPTTSPISISPITTVPLTTVPLTISPITTSPSTSVTVSPSIVTVSTAHPLTATSTHEEAFGNKLKMLGAMESFLQSVTQDVQANKTQHGLEVPDEFEALSAAEKIAIWNYTRQYFKLWNPPLRDDAGAYTKRGFKNQEPGIRVCTTALLKLPVYDDVVYRVENAYRPDRHDSAVTGKVMDWWAFSSSGFNLEFLKKSEFYGAIEWHIVAGHQGRRIDFISANPKEGEVLFAPGTKMRVRNRSGLARKGHIVIIEIEQIA